MLRSGPKEPLTIESPSNNIGHMWKMPYEGVIPRFRRLYLNRDISKLKKTLQEEILTHVHKGPCKTCGGTGLNPQALASKIKGRNIVDYFEMPVCDLLPVLAEINNPVGVSLAKQIMAYLGRMVEVGIGYLSLSRRTDTLSGGEVQRIKMVRNLGSSLSNITYIFDEPTAGLHPADADRIGRPYHRAGAAGWDEGRQDRLSGRFGWPAPCGHDYRTGHASENRNQSGPLALDRGL